MVKCSEAHCQVQPSTTMYNQDQLYIFWILNQIWIRSVPTVPTVPSSSFPTDEFGCDEAGFGRWNRIRGWPCGSTMTHHDSFSVRKESRHYSFFFRYTHTHIYIHIHIMFFQWYCSGFISLQFFRAIRKHPQLCSGTLLFWATLSSEIASNVVSWSHFNGLRVMEPQRLASGQRGLFATHRWGRGSADIDETSNQLDSRLV